ncbi:MAG TPA: hypothetical protein PLX69_02085 [Leptospiraceae bacterium]|nr:hypothetical protein [Leptospiraceae bacterium]
MDSLKIYERLKSAKFDEAKAKELASIFFRSSTVRWVAGLMLVNTGLMVSMLKFL